MPAECLDATGGAQPGSPCAQTIKSEAFEAARRARAAKNRAKIGVPA